MKASAQSTELVQMFEVAFSRRICCSRVDRVSTKPRLPSASTVSPASRPGICRTYFSRVRTGRHRARRTAGRRRSTGPRRRRCRRPSRPAILISAQRDRLGHHRDQQRALRHAPRSASAGQVGDPAEDVGILDDDAAGLAVDRGDQPLGVGRRRSAPAARSSSTSPVNLRHRLRDRDIMRMQAATRGSPCPAA